MSGALSPYPSCSQRYRYITGLQGNVKLSYKNTFQGQKIHLDPKNSKSLLSIRWGFDPDKRCHVNAGLFSTQDQVVKTPGKPKFH